MSFNSASLQLRCFGRTHETGACNSTCLADLAHVQVSKTSDENMNAKTSGEKTKAKTSDEKMKAKKSDEKNESKNE